MGINNNEDIIIDEIVWIRQLFFSYVTFLSSRDLSVVLNISRSHAYTNLPNRPFSHEEHVICKY